MTSEFKPNVVYVLEGDDGDYSEVFGVNHTIEGAKSKAGQLGYEGQWTDAAVESVNGDAVAIMDVVAVHGEDTTWESLFIWGFTVGA